MQEQQTAARTHTLPEHGELYVGLDKHTGLPGSSLRLAVLCGGAVNEFALLALSRSYIFPFAPITLKVGGCKGPVYTLPRGIMARYLEGCPIAKVGNVWQVVGEESVNQQFISKGPMRWWCAPGYEDRAVEGVVRQAFKGAPEGQRHHLDHTIEIDPMAPDTPDPATSCHMVVATGVAYGVKREDRTNGTGLVRTWAGWVWRLSRQAKRITNRWSQDSKDDHLVNTAGALTAGVKKALLEAGYKGWWERGE